MKNLSLFFVVVALTSAQTQTTAPSTYATQTLGGSSTTPSPSPVPTVSRTIKAMHYRLQGGSTRVEVHGTDLIERATGEAKVAGLEDATEFGLEYLT